MSYRHTKLYQETQKAEQQLIRYHELEEKAFYRSVSTGLLTERPLLAARRDSLYQILATAIRKHHQNILMKKWLLADEHHRLIMNSATTRPLFIRFTTLEPTELEQELERTMRNIQFYGSRMVEAQKSINLLGGDPHGTKHVLEKVLSNLNQP